MMTSECVLYYDMYKLLKDPFYPKERRQVYYYSLYFLVAVCVISYFLISDNDFNSEATDN